VKASPVAGKLVTFRWWARREGGIW